MTNTEFFSQIYGSDTVQILSDHGMAITSATETLVCIAYESAVGNINRFVTLECDDNMSFVDAMVNYVSDFGQDRIADREMFETAAAELCEAQEKRPTHLVHLELEADLYEKLCLLSNENDINTTLLSLIKDTRVPLDKLSGEQREMVLDEAKALIVPLLTEAVAKETYGKTSVEITPSSYDDVISPNTIMESYDEYCKLKEQGKTSCEGFKEYFADKLYDRYFWESVADEEYRLYKDVSERIEEAINADDKLAEAWEMLEETYQQWEILELGGLTGGVYVDLNAFLNNATYHINLLFAGENERNLDMSAIPTLFNDNDYIIEDAKEFAEYQDNALSYLINQQGYTTADVFSKNGLDNEFIKSVKVELDNTVDSMSELTLLTSCGGVELVELLDKISKGEGFIEFSEKTETGLFNEWSGGGSVLEINLEKPAVFPASMVRNVQFEGAKSKDYGYTVNDVYGVVGSVWDKSTVKLTDTPPTLREEDLEATRKGLLNAAKESEKNIEERE